MHITLYTYMHIQLLLLFWWNPFISSRKLDEVFTYNHMSLMSLRSCSHAKASMVFTRDDNYLYTIILRLILMVRTRLEPISY